MSITEITKLPLREKLQLMEAIWVDFSEQADGLKNSSEHHQLLDARRARVSAGKSALHDWDAVKPSL